MADTNLADVFAEEPPDGTVLVAWFNDGNLPIPVWRDDKRAYLNAPEKRWFTPGWGPDTFRRQMQDATQVHAAVPLEQSELKLTEEAGR